MKKLILLALVCMFMATMSGCGSSGGTAATTSTTSPTPIAANDALNTGVYKGVFTGSTGHWFADINNTDITKATLTFTFDGVTLTLDGVQTMSGSNFVYTFTGSGYTMVLEVTPTGSIVSAGTSFTFTGHTGAIYVSGDKATSTVDVSAWEGTWIQTSGNNPGETGPWNIITKGSMVYGSSVGCDIAGTVSGTSLTVTCGADTTATGTTNGLTVTGTWTDATAGGSGTWSGTKSL